MPKLSRSERLAHRARRRALRSQLLQAEQAARRDRQARKNRPAEEAGPAEGTHRSGDAPAS